MGQHRKAILLCKLLVFLISFAGAITFWTWGILAQDNLPITLAATYTILTLWTFDRWFTLRRDKL